MADATKERAKNRSPAARRNNAIARAVGDPVSRRKFVALTGGSSALAAFLAACGGSDDDSTSTSGSATTTATGGAIPPPPADTFGKGDLGILNYALTLEYLETAFYRDVVSSGLFKGDELATIKKFGDEEAEHVAALTAAVKQSGGTPAPMPKTKFPLDSADNVLMLAATVENLGAAAYLGQAGNIQSPQVLASALAIHSVEGRHASALNTLLGQSITPDGAFAKPATPMTVLNSVQPYIVS
jgi:Ferritin-like domain